MDYSNADGRPAEMCGNGIRCLAKYVYERGHTTATELVVDTRDGLKHLTLDVDPRRAKCGRSPWTWARPTLDAGEVPMTGGEPGERFTRAAVRRGRPDVDGVGRVHGQPPPRAVPRGRGRPRRGWTCPASAATDRAPRRSSRTGRTSSSSSSRDPSRLRIRIWERGVGETMACGTGACAALVAARGGRTDRTRAAIEVPGGVLHVEWRDGRPRAPDRARRPGSSTGSCRTSGRARRGSRASRPPSASGRGA